MSQGYLSTHILDTASGVPAAKVRVVLYRIEGSSRTQIADMSTNADGRTETPILPTELFDTGEYTLEFHVGPYFDAQQRKLPSPKFLDVIPIHFGISDKNAHYHVPLLVSPFGYSTYRGS